MDLIEQMLEINPYMRPSSLECLTSGAFKAEVSELGIKDRQYAEKLELPIDDDNVFDYEKGEFNELTLS